MENSTVDFFSAGFGGRGTQITCFTSTKVQIMTRLRRQEEARLWALCMAATTMDSTDGASSRYSVYLLYWYIQILTQLGRAGAGDRLRVRLC
jgi:hypothetical protein